MAVKGGWNFQSTYTNLPENFFSYMTLNPVSAPELILFNEDLAKDLDLDVAELQANGASIFAGNEAPEDATLLSQAYVGHQFGYLARLGDGRAILIGEHHTRDGRRVDIQLKGAGKTPYSRGGDGRAALGPMLREYLISEAMYGLGIPTTRALAVTTTGEPIVRETLLEGAVLTRVAQSHLRVGTFEYAYHLGTDADIEQLVDYAIDSLYPSLREANNKALALLEKVIEKQAQLLAKWQLVGFVHGVMNTDNMTISGETIDYGPCAFMDRYALHTLFSSIDRQGRYAYGKQPSIGEWNLARFAETLLPLLDEEEDKGKELAMNALANYRLLYEQSWLAGLKLKLGMKGETAADQRIIGELLQLMEHYEADYTNTFLALTFQQFENEALFESEAFKNWLGRWKERVSFEAEKEALKNLMKQHNPALIPRNYYVEEAITAAVETKDLTKIRALLEALKDPFAHTKAQRTYQFPPEEERPYQTFCGT